MNAVLGGRSVGVSREIADVIDVARPFTWLLPESVETRVRFCAAFGDGVIASR